MFLRTRICASCAAMAAAGALTVLTGTVAVADTPGTPASGSMITLPEQVRGVVLSCDGHQYTVDLAGAGQMILGKAVAHGDETRVPVTTEVESLIGYSADFGEVSAAETAPLHGELVQSATGSETDTMPMELTITIGRNPCQQTETHAVREPLILTTKDPAKLIGSLTQFPPKDDVYQLQNPIDLIDLDNPDVTVATIDRFPVKVGGL